MISKSGVLNKRIRELFTVCIKQYNSGTPVITCICAACLYRMFVLEQLDKDRPNEVVVVDE